MEMKYAVPQKHGHKAVTVVLIILAVLLAAAGVLLWMVLSDPNAGRGLDKIQATDTLPKEVATAAIARKECSFSVDDVNGYLAFLFQKYEAEKKGGSVKIQAMAISGASGKSADLYLPVEYNGKHLGVVLNLTPSLDSTNNRLLFQVNSAQIGRLPVDPGWLLQKTKNRLPQRFSVSDNTISCESPSVEASVLKISASVKLGDLRMENGALKVGAKTEIKVG